MEPKFESAEIQDGLLGAEIKVCRTSVPKTYYQKGKRPEFVHKVVFEITTQDNEEFQLELDDTSIRELRVLCTKLLNYFAAHDDYHAAMTANEPDDDEYSEPDYPLDEGFAQYDDNDL